MRRSWIALCAVAVVAAAGGLVAGNAMADDDPMAGGAPQFEKPIDGHGLVKLLTANPWTLKSTSDQGAGEGTTSFRLGASKTVMVQDYMSKSAMGEFGGLGVTKISADGKTASMWWFSTMGDEPDEFTGAVTDSGYELKGDTGMGKVVIKLAKKGEGLEFTYSVNGALMFTDNYAKAK